MEKIPLTVIGHARLQEELKHRKSVERPAIIEAISEARAHGDLSENAEYHAAKEKQSFNEGRIQELEGVLSLAQIIDPKTLSGNTVKFGATVRIVDDNDHEQTFQIVGAYESNTDEGRISMTAPLARGLIGKAVGDSVTIQTPKGAVNYEILSVVYQ